MFFNYSDKFNYYNAEVAELVDAHDSKSCAREGVWVRVPPSVQISKSPSKRGFFYCWLIF